MLSSLMKYWGMTPLSVNNINQTASRIVPANTTLRIAAVKVLLPFILTLLLLRLMYQYIQIAKSAICDEYQFQYGFFSTIL
jgi:hypothetical protein